MNPAEKGKTVKTAKSSKCAGFDLGEAADSATDLVPHLRAGMFFMSYLQPVTLCQTLTRACVFICGTGVILGGLSVGAEDLDVLANKEVRRRSALVAEADAQVREGYLLLNSGKNQEAVTIFGSAYRSMPTSPLTEATRASARDGYAAAAMGWARELLREGRMQEAENLVKTVISPEMDPGNEKAVRLLKEMGDPERFPPALTAKHVTNVKRVAETLAMGHSKLELGDFDAASVLFTDVLRVDPYNTAARRGMERAEQERARYFNAARDHTRAKMLNGVNASWEDAVPPTTADLEKYSQARGDSLRNVQGNREKIVQKLRTMIVPKVDFAGASLDEVVEFLRVRSRDLDPTGKGVDFVLNLPPETSGATIDLAVTNMPMEEVVRYCADKVGAAFKVDEFAVKFVSLTESSTEFFVRTYRVPPGFIESAPAAAAAAPADPFAANAAPAGGVSAIRRLTAREFLEARGVAFPEGATANYNLSSNRLVVRNTASNLEMVESMVESAAESAPKQALISIKMIEINQSNLEEMGFDWLLGSFNAPGSDGVFLSGGTTGNAQAGDAPSQNFPMQFPGTGVPVGQNPVTAGLRSSGEIFAKPTIENLLGENLTQGLPSARSPGQFAVSGVLTDPQFQVVVRALNQKKGVDLLAMPSIVTKGGQKATIDLAREFRYPTEFDPPEIPQQVGSIPTGGNVRIIADNNTGPITPSTPTTFEMRKVGTVIEMEPVISANGKEVEILLTPESTEFEGFIDYGSDINNQVQTAGALVNQPVDNRIIQPIFRTNKISTALKIYDGSTVVLGGVLQDRRVNIQDKVPVIGDIPLVGQFWKSKVDQVDKKAFVVFVSVRVLDPSGQPVNQLEAMPTTAAGQ
jgi:general secretion pathway protein D